LKLPFNSVRIGHRDYSIIIESPPFYYEGYEVDGLCCKHKGQITLVKGDLIYMKSSLIHELFHGIFHEHGVDMVKDDEERIVSSIERSMMQVIRDNQLMMEWLIGA